MHANELLNAMSFNNPTDFLSALFYHQVRDITGSNVYQTLLPKTKKKYVKMFPVD